MFGEPTETISFPVTAPAETGDYQQTVSTPGGDATATTTVVESDAESASPDEADANEDGDDGSGPGFGVAAVLIAVFVGSAVLHRRK